MKRFKVKDELVPEGEKKTRVKGGHCVSSSTSNKDAHSLNWSALSHALHHETILLFPFHRRPLSGSALTERFDEYVVLRGN